jgi:hypothetical protein
MQENPLLFDPARNTGNDPRLPIKPARHGDFLRMLCKAEADFAGACARPPHDSPFLSGH